MNQIKNELFFFAELEKKNIFCHQNVFIFSFSGSSKYILNNESFFTLNTKILKTSNIISAFHSWCSFFFQKKS